MTTIPATIKDIFESAEKYGEDNVLSWDPENFKPKKKTTGGFDCNWIPIKFKFKNGTESRLVLNFKKVITSSTAKLPKFNDNGIKNMFISFRKVSEEEIAVGDFVAKKMTTEAEQIIEDKKMEMSVKETVAITNEFNDAIAIIDKSYRKICKEMKSAKSLGFSVRKDKKIKMEDINENSIIQTHRNDADNNDADPIELEFPLTRIKLMVSKNGQIAVDTWDNASKAFKSKPNVFDARKMTAKNEYKPTLATVKVDGKSRPLDSDNAGTFISYRSVLGGQIEFPEIIISKVGFSLSNKFLDVFVRRNKSNLQEATFSKDDLKEMAGDEDEESEEEVEMQTVEETKKTSLSAKFEKTKIGVNTDVVSDLEDSDAGSDLEDNCEDKSGSDSD